MLVNEVLYLYLQPVIPRGCSEGGLDAFSFFYETATYLYSKSMDQQGKVANPARGQLDENGYRSVVSPNDQGAPCCVVYSYYNIKVHIYIHT